VENDYKMRMHSEKLWKEHRSTPRFKMKSFANQNYYRNFLGGSAAMRITVPALSPNHLDSAIKEFSNLVEALKEVQKQQTKPHFKISAMRTQIYNCHVSLKEQANDSFVKPLNPTVDYRGAK
tara:strand:- start:1597 stop:1962 length:366 start_codon:yes stop_codon:yes gene_type:complete